MRMGTVRAWRLVPLVAIALFATAVTPVAVVAADGPATRGSAAGASSATTKKLKVLKRQTAALLQRVSALEAALAKQPVAGPPVPTSLPPRGPAGGDLTGNYPDPQLRANSVLSSDLLDGTIGSPDVAEGAIGATQIADQSLTTGDIADGGLLGLDLAQGSVGSKQLGIARVVTASRAVAPGLIRASEVSCPEGTQLIGGGGEWRLPENPEIAQASSLRVLNYGPQPPTIPNETATTWEIVGVNNSQSTFSLFVRALCLD